MATQAARQGTPSGPSIDPRARRRAIVSSVIGNGLEWFDFGIYSSFSIIVSRLMLQAMAVATVKARNLRVVKMSKPAGRIFEIYFLKAIIRQ